MEILEERIDDNVEKSSKDEITCLSLGYKGAIIHPKG